MVLDRVKRYARQHQRPVSELFRDGIEWRIGEGDLLNQTYAMGGSAEQDYPSNTEIPTWRDRDREIPSVLHEIQTALARQEAQLHTLTQTLEHRPAVSPPDAYYGNTTQVPPEQQSTPEPVREGYAAHGNTVLQAAPDPVPAQTLEAPIKEKRQTAQSTQRQTPAPEYDATKYVLGAKLCAGKHDYLGTGKTLLTMNGRKCPQCQTDQQRQRRAARRQTSPAS
jgi:hypothetical protein